MNRNYHKTTSREARKARDSRYKEAYKKVRKLPMKTRPSEADEAAIAGDMAQFDGRL